MTLPAAWRSLGFSSESGQAWVHKVCSSRTCAGDRPYALKLLKNPARADRFRREVHTMKRLWSEGLRVIPEVIESGEHRGRPYFVMPWYEGGSLQDAIDAQTYSDDPVRAVELLADLASAIAQVHAAGVAHRDIKPANILLSEDGVVLGDFGLCLAAEEPEARFTATEEGVGSRFYIAPENESGVNDDVDQRPADAYAFSKVLWAILAGRNPPAREQQIEPGRYRLEAVRQDDRYARLFALQRSLLETDPRVRIVDWDTVTKELDAFRKVLTGDNSPTEAVLRPNALDAARRVAALPSVVRTQGRIVGTQAEVSWAREVLLSRFRTALQLQLQAQVQPIIDETRGLVEVALSGESVPLPALLSQTGVSVPIEVPLTGTNIDTSEGAFIGITLHSPNGIHEFPPLYLAIYAPVQPDQFWLVSVPYIRPNALDMNTASAPPALQEIGAAVRGPLRARFEHSLDAAEEFARESVVAFGHIVAQYLDLVAGGFDPSDASSWNASTRVTDWVVDAPVNLPRSHHMAAVEEGRRIVIAGGQTESGISDVEVYDPNTRTWSLAEPLPYQLLMAAMATDADGVVHLFGGEGDGRVQPGTLRRDPRAGSWQPRTPLRHPRTDLCAALYQQVIYVVGGHNGGAVSDVVEVYSSSTDSWDAAAPLGIARRGAAIASADSLLFVFGGLTTAGEFSDGVEVLDGSDTQWAATTSMPRPRAWFSAALGPGGRIYIIGGRNASGVPLRDVDVFDPASHSWTEGPPLRLARENLAVATLPDMSLFAIAGTNRRGHLAQVEAMRP